VGCNDSGVTRLKVIGRRQRQQSSFFVVATKIVQFLNSIKMEKKDFSTEELFARLKNEAPELAAMLRGQNPKNHADSKFPTINAQNQTVSARELYDYLEVSSEFAKWIKRMLDYGFVANEDYSLVKIGERSAHNKIDYDLTMDTAKEISMIQRSAKGKEARQYFIECEKRFQKAKAAFNTLSETVKVDAKGQMSLFDLPDSDMIRAQRLAMDVALQAKNGSKTAQLLRILSPYLFTHKTA
jgi:phage anti-repressor protein